MAVAVNSMINKTEIILHDEGNTRWAATELIDWGSEGENFIITRKPDAYVKQEAFVLVAGTLQSIAGAFLIMDIVRNMGTTGTTPGKPITKVDRKDLDIDYPGWHTATASATVKHWMPDERTPSKFYVYPPQPVSAFGKVEGIWSESPPALEVGGDINLALIYESVIINYILFRAYCKDAAIHPLANQRAIGYLSAVLTALGSQENVEALYAAMTR